MVQSALSAALRHLLKYIRRLPERKEYLLPLLLYLFP
jgi:hypothetical protein